MTRGQAQAATAILLAVAAGCVDAVSFLLLHHIYTANMTGNTTKLGIAVGRANWSGLVPLGVAVAVFVVAIGLGTALIEVAARRGMRANAAPALAAEAALVAVFMLDGHHLVSHGVVPDHTIGGFYLLLTVAIVAMGIQTVSLTKALGKTIRTTYVSGLLTTISQEAVNVVAPPRRGRPSYLRDELGLGSRRDSLLRLAFHALVWSSFAAGAVWGGYALARWSTWALALALAVILMAVVVDLLTPVHPV